MILGLSIFTISILGSPSALSPESVGPPLDARASPAAGQEWSRLRREQRRARALTAGGFASLGVVHVATFGLGVASGTLGFDPSAVVAEIPVAGPIWLSAATTRTDWKALFAVDALAQLGLLSAGIVGAVRLRRTGRALKRSAFTALDRRFNTRIDGDLDLLRQRRLGLGLGVGGLAGFGVAYLGTLIAFSSAESDTLLDGQDQVQRQWALLPLAGPIVLASQAEGAGVRTLASTLGVIQIGGLATGVGGALIMARRTAEGERRVLRELSILPLHGGHVRGVAVHGRF